MRVLVVEDEHKIAQSIKKGLEQEAYAVDVSYTGPDGLDMVEGEEYDLIILDILLPGINGIDICKTLRKQNVHTPVLMLTAKGQVEDKVEGLDAGADDYLTKPFALDELLARVRALVRRPQNTMTAVLRCEDLSLDPKNREVLRDGETVIVSKREYAILDYMLRHPGQILSKEQIIDHVWDYEADILLNTVEVFMGNLRNKIDKPFPQNGPLIHTIRGFGYRLGKAS